MTATSHSLGEISAFWVVARRLHTIYAELDRTFELGMPPCPDLPQDASSPEVLGRARQWFDNADGLIHVWQLRQLLQSTNLQTEENLRCLIHRHLEKKEKTESDKEKIDFLLVQYFAHCAPEGVIEHPITLEGVARVLEPALGRVAAEFPEWIVRLDEKLAKMNDCNSLEELQESGGLGEAREMKVASGDQYFDPGALIAFTRFNFLARRAFFRAMHIDLHAIRSTVNELERLGFASFDCRDAGLSEKESVQQLRHVVHQWKTPFRAPYSSGGESFHQLISLRQSLEKKLETARSGRAKSVAAGAPAAEAPPARSAAAPPADAVAASTSATPVSVTPAPPAPTPVPNAPPASGLKASPPLSASAAPAGAPPAGAALKATPVVEARAAAPAAPAAVAKPAAPAAPVLKATPVPEKSAASPASAPAGVPAAAIPAPPASAAQSLMAEAASTITRSREEEEEYLQRCVTDIADQLAAMPPKNSPGVSTIHLGGCKLLIATWEADAFKGTAEPLRALQRAVAARTILHVCMERHKKNEATDLSAAMEIAQRQAEEMKAQVLHAKEARNIDAAVNLAATAKRLMALVEEGLKLRA